MLALREHYNQQVQSKREVGNGESQSGDDAWALDWINLRRLQAIAEAFDDDASGFITIAEVNQFTASRPWGANTKHPTESDAVSSLTVPMSTKVLHWWRWVQ